MSTNRTGAINRRFGNSEDEPEGQVAFFVFNEIVILCEPGSELQERLKAFAKSLSRFADEWFAYGEAVANSKRYRKPTASDEKATDAMKQVGEDLKALKSVDLPKEIVHGLGRLALAVRRNAQEAGRAKSRQDVYQWN